MAALWEWFCQGNQILINPRTTLLLCAKKWRLYHFFNYTGLCSCLKCFNRFEGLSLYWKIVIPSGVQFMPKWTKRTCTGGLVSVTVPPHSKCWLQSQTLHIKDALPMQGIILGQYLCIDKDQMVGWPSGWATSTMVRGVGHGESIQYHWSNEQSNED